MELNNKATNKYISYMKKIGEYWQDQVDAGTWGRADADEVLGSFKSLGLKIAADTTLPIKYKKELCKIIMEKSKKVNKREKEIKGAEKAYNAEKNLACRDAIKRYESLSPDDKERFYQLYEKLIMGYNIFFTPEEFQQMFTEEFDLTELKKKYPIIAEDIEAVMPNETKQKSK